MNLTFKRIGSENSRFRESESINHNPRSKFKDYEKKLFTYVIELCNFLFNSNCFTRLVNLNFLCTDLSGIGHIQALHLVYDHNMNK